MVEDLFRNWNVASGEPESKSLPNSFTQDLQGDTSTSEGAGIAGLS